jgi:ferredoxin-thioredoxin reductase catalytic chain
METNVRREDRDALFEKLDREARESGYNLNPDPGFTLELVESLLINEGRYGYWACPCRLAEGDKTEDLDIICPCDYRDEDLEEYGTCYCALYVSAAAVRGEVPIKPIPERRPSRKRRKQFLKPQGAGGDFHGNSLPVPVWRCNVCGYLCARNTPPEVCPICKAKKERFARFL